MLKVNVKKANEQPPLEAKLKCTLNFDGILPISGTRMIVRSENPFETTTMLVFLFL